MKNSNFQIVLGFVALMLIFIITVSHNQLKIEENVQLDLPEEYSQATSNDTLIAIKQGDTLFVQFNNK